MYTCYAKTLALKYSLLGLMFRSKNKTFLEVCFWRVIFLPLKICMSKRIILRFWETAHLPLP